MIIHLPHNSTKIDGLVELQDLDGNLYALTDSYTKNLFAYDDANLIFPYSRFVCDVERFKENEPMDDIGQGIIHKKDYYGNDIKRNISDSETLKMYDEHHIKFNRNVNFQLGLYPKVVVVDCHSFWSWAFFADENIDICIGTDDFHTPKKIQDILVNYFEEIGYNTSINYPFGDAIVPSQHYKKTSDVYSIMIDMNKNLYYHDIELFNKANSVIQGALNKIDEFEQTL